MRAVVAALLCALSLCSTTARGNAAAPIGDLVDDAALVGRVLETADERLALMPAVAAAKWIRHLPVSDPPREAAVVQAVTDRAGQVALAPAAVAMLLRLQIGLAHGAQQQLFDRWASTGFDGAAPPRDLPADLRPELDRITAAMIDALYLAAPAFSRKDFGAWANTLSQRLLPGERWNDEQRHALLSALASISRTAPPSLARARAAGFLRIGTPGDYAPFSVAADRGVTGADVELALGLAATLHLRAIFVRTTWRGLIDDLRADRFDIAVGGISVTAARAALATFSLPTAHSGKTAIGRCTDSGRLNSLAAIDDPRVTAIVNAGGTNELFARSHLKRAQLLVHADNRTIFEEIAAHRADVMFTDETEIELATHRNHDLCRLLATTFDSTDKAFLMPRESDWAEAVDHWLREQLRAGTAARLLSEYLQR